METLKKSLVLGEITEGFAIYGKSVSGIARVEKEAGGSVFSLSLVNLLPTKIGSFYAAVSDGDGNFYYFDLGKNPCSITKKISGFDKIDGVSAGLFLIDSGLPVLIAFCRENNPALSTNVFPKRKRKSDKVTTTKSSRRKIIIFTTANLKKISTRWKN